jgi:hypothetical protein
MISSLVTQMPGPVRGMVRFRVRPWPTSGLEVTVRVRLGVDRDAGPGSGWSGPGPTAATDSRLRGRTAAGPVPALSVPARGRRTG